MQDDYQKRVQASSLIRESLYGGALDQECNAVVSRRRRTDARMLRLPDV